MSIVRSGLSAAQSIEVLREAIGLAEELMSCEGFTPHKRNARVLLGRLLSCHIKRAEAWYEGREVEARLMLVVAQLTGKSWVLTPEKRRG